MHIATLTVRFPEIPHGTVPANQRGDEVFLKIFCGYRSRRTTGTGTSRWFPQSRAQPAPSLAKIPNLHPLPRQPHSRQPGDHVKGQMADGGPSIIASRGFTA